MPEKALVEGRTLAYANQSCCGEACATENEHGLIETIHAHR